MSYRLPLRFLTFFGCVSALATSLFAASVLEFPRLVLDGNTITGIALVNGSNEEASVTLTAYDLSGGALASTQITLPAETQIAQLASEIFPQLPPAFEGWIRASSEVDGLTGFFLFLDGGLRQFDGADLPIRSRRLVFNQIRQGNGFSTELNLINTSTESTTVRLTLLSGGTIGAAARQLPARGGLRQDVAELFQLDELPEGGVVRAEADRDMVGFEVVRSGDGDLLGLNARSMAERLNTIYFPQAAVLGAIRSQLGLVNYSSQDASVAIAFHRPDGSLYQNEVNQNPASLNIPAGRGVARDLAELFGFSGSLALEGWLEVTSRSRAINGYLTYRIEPVGATAAVAPVGQGATAALFSHIATTRGFFTGIAVLNPGRVAADLRIVTLSASGQRLGVFDTVLPPGTRISRLITDLIPAAGGQDGGLVWIRSNQPIFASSLFGTNSGTILANIPPQAALPTFQPDSGLARTRILPALAVVEPQATLQFQAEGTDDPVQWAVQGVNGGTVESGNISATGDYQAPAEAPRLPLVVTARSGGNIGSATVDILESRNLQEEMGPLLAATYLPERQRLVLARLNGDSGATELFELGPGLEPAPITVLENERVSALLPLEVGGVEHLLAVGTTSGRVLRVNPAGGDVLVVASGLSAPQGLDLDPLTGGLLVAEADQLTLLGRGSPGLQPLSSQTSSKAKREKASLLRVEGLDRLAVDQCTGQVYASSLDGDRLLRLHRESGLAEEIMSGLAGLSDIQLLYRRGVSCPQASHLWLSEQAADRISLYLPATGEAIPGISGEAQTAAFVPSSNPYHDGAALLLVDSPGDTGRLSLVELQDLYDAAPINPPLARLGAAGSAPGPDLFLSDVSTQQGGLSAVTVSYRSAPAGQPGGEGLTAMAFTIEFDPNRLSLDTSDGDGNGIPDSIQSALPSDFTLYASAMPEAGRVDLVIADFSRPFSPIPSGDLVSIVFQARPGQVGTSDVTIREQPQPSAANSQGQVRRFDETRSGVVFIQP